MRRQGFNAQTGNVGNGINRKEMALASGGKKNLKIRYILLAAVVILVAAGWSGGWLFLQQELDRQIELQLETANRSGTTIACEERAIAGYPFRFEVNCSKPVAAAASGTRVSLEGLNAIALVYNPRHIILEADGPATISDPLSGQTISTDWSSARSSVIFSDQGARRFDAVVENITGSVSGPVPAGLNVDKAELHVRPVPDVAEAAEAFFSADGLSMSSSDSAEAAPDIRLHVRLENGAALLSGMPLHALPRDAAGSLPLELKLLSLSSGNTEISAAGTLQLTASGTVSGKLDVRIKGVKGAGDLLAGFFPAESPIPESLQGIAVALGKPEPGTDTIRLPVTVDNGQLKVGFVPLGVSIPQLAPAAF
jgi:hypothetical protein